LDPKATKPGKALNNSNPRLSVVIHTEEEFDWDNGFYQSNTRVTHGKELIDFCERLIEIGAKITFALDYAFVKSEEGKGVIQHFLPKMNSEVEFASHLHPWVNPPFDIKHNNSQNLRSGKENPIDEKDSYPGNLSQELEFAKLKTLTEAIMDLTGQAPTTYLAGRYGIGKNTNSTLKKLGYKTDISISPFVDFGYQQGPDFSDFNNQAFTKNGIVNIPHTTGFVSHIPALSKYLNNNARNFKKLNNSVLGKILFRLAGVKRHRLSPEGFSLNEMKQVTKALLRTDTEHLIFSFHSPSVKLGLTPYVRSKEQLLQFYESSYDFMVWFQGELSGQIETINKL